MIILFKILCIILFLGGMIYAGMGVGVLAVIIKDKYKKYGFLIAALIIFAFFILTVVSTNYLSYQIVYYNEK